MEFGWTSKILEVNLNNGKSEIKKISQEVLRKFIGGRGLGIYYLYKMAGPNVEALSGDNPIIFATGPACGTLAPSCGLYSLTTKSPLTGTCLSAHSGGYFGSAIKFAGYDALIIRGKADKPCYILVDNSSAQIMEASHLWGLDVLQTTKELKRIYGSASVAAIGPAGENQVLISSVMNDYNRATARGGPGAVMGYKKIKAVVIKGTGSLVRVFNIKEFCSIVEEANILLKKRGLGLNVNGTAGVVKIVNDNGILPTNNFQSTFFSAANQIGANALKQFNLRNKACFGCSVGCSKIRQVEDLIVEGPEYETIYALGSNCGNADVRSIIKLNDLCNRWGVDTISMGATIAFAIELYEKGVISLKDTGGLKLKWGDTSTIEELARRIVFREGIGDIFAEGSLRAAKQIGSQAEKYAIHVKGLELPGYDPRGALGMGLAYATSNRGACHLRAMMHVVEVFEAKLDRFSWEKKAETLKELQDVSSVIDSLVMCKFVARHGFDNSPAKLARLLTVLTGWDWSQEEIECAGEKIYNLERLYNTQAGFNRKDDQLPDRFFYEPVPNGPIEGCVVNIGQFQESLHQYYMLRGWDSDGVPTPQKISSLELDKVVKT